MRKILFYVSFSLLIAGFLSCRSSKPFKMVLLPDTQTYCRSYPEIFKAQTQWIADNADQFAFVLHQGDITDNNSEEQWKIAEASMSLLDGKLPVTVVPGNHDTGEKPGGRSDVRNNDLFNKHFPYEKYSRMKTFGGAFETGKMENTWHTFKAGGYKWLILSLEFGPRNRVLDWAAGVIEAHPRHKVILNTHAYMYSDNTRMGSGNPQKWLPQGYGLGKATGADAVNNGEQIWEKLLSKYPNVIFAFSGHVLNEGTGRLVSTGVHGNSVYQMLANFQGGVINTVKGGNGFLRLVTVDPKKKKISVQTYSPYVDEYKTEDTQQFEYSNVKF